MKHLEGFKHLKSGYSESVWKDDIQYIEDISKIASDEGVNTYIKIDRSKRRSKTKLLEYDLILWIHRHPTKESKQELCSTEEFATYAMEIADRIKNLGLGVIIDASFRDKYGRRGDQIIRMVDNPLHYKDKKVATFKFTIYQTRQPKLFKKY